MKPFLSVLMTVALGVMAVAISAAMPQTNAGTTTIRAARLLDGRGKSLTNAVIEVQGSKIVKIDQRKGPVTYDLGNVTLMPGMIDVHVHLQWYFGPSGKYGERNVPPEYVAKAIDDNAHATLMAGFTTVQSPGWNGDKALRERTANGTLAGPRILTSLSPISPRMATPDRPGTTPEALREMVKQRKADGADFIKVFASASIRDGGAITVTQEQMDAVCGEAKAQGLRTIVHAHGADSIIVSVKAGCDEIEHGMFANDAAIQAMKDAHTYFDPNIGLVLQNYIANKDKYMGSGNFNDAGFASMEKALPLGPAVFKKAMAAGLKMPMGTDAVAGAHGRNAEETIARVKAAGQKPMDAIIGTTSLAAEAIGMGQQIGSLQPGYEADIIAVSGDPVKNIESLRDVVFVMKGGTVYKK